MLRRTSRRRRVTSESPAAVAALRVPVASFGCELTASSASLPTNTIDDHEIRAHAVDDRAEEQLLFDRAVALHAGVDHAVACRRAAAVQAPFEQLAERLLERDLHREHQRIAEQQHPPLVRRLGPELLAVSKAVAVDGDVGGELRSLECGLALRLHAGSRATGSLSKSPWKAGAASELPHVRSAASKTANCATTTMASERDAAQPASARRALAGRRRAHAGPSASAAVTGVDRRRGQRRVQRQREDLARRRAPRLGRRLAAGPRTRAVRERVRIVDQRLDPLRLQVGLHGLSHAASDREEVIHVSGIALRRDRDVSHAAERLAVRRRTLPPRRRPATAATADARAAPRPAFRRAASSRQTPCGGICPPARRSAAAPRAPPRPHRWSRSRRRPRARRGSWSGRS